MEVLAIIILVLAILLCVTLVIRATLAYSYNPDPKLENADKRIAKISPRKTRSLMN